MFRRLVLSLAIAAFFASNAFAGNIYNFYSFRQGSPTSGLSDIYSFSVEVTDYTDATGDVGSVAGGNLVSFLFKNESTVESTIAQIYFDDGTLLQLPDPEAINDDPTGAGGVDFEQGANPATMPGGENIDWNTSGNGFEMVYGAENPAPTNGIDMGETLEIIIELQDDLEYQDTIDAMEYSQTSIYEDLIGGLRIGMHVISLNGGPSDSLVNGGEGETEPPFPGIGGNVPEPTSALIWGLLGLTGMSVRRKRSK